MTTTKYYKVRVYVGPVHVDHYVAQARTNGLTETFGGTQHVWGVLGTPELRNESDRLCFRQRVADRVRRADGGGLARRRTVQRPLMWIAIFLALVLMTLLDDDEDRAPSDAERAFFDALDAQKQRQQDAPAPTRATVPPRDPQENQRQNSTGL